MASNILFKHYQIDDYIEIAEETAGWLKSDGKKDRAWKEMDSEIRILRRIFILIIQCSQRKGSLRRLCRYRTCF